MVGDKIEIQTVREVVNAIFDFVQNELGVESLTLERNFYWSIDEEQLFNMDAPPTSHDVGSLLDDVEFVMAAHGDRKQALPILLQHVAPLLRELGQKLPNFS